MKQLLLFYAFLTSFMLLGQKKKAIVPIKEPPHITCQKSAERAFQNGEYKRAEELYRYCTNLIYVENIEETRKKIQICRELNQKKQKALNLFIDEKYVDASKVYDEILKINPLDPSAKKGEKLCNSPKIPSKETERIIAYARTLPKEKALSFLISTNKDKPDPQFLVEIDRRQHDKILIPPIPIDPLIALEKQLRSKLNNCNFAGAISTAKQILKISPDNLVALKNKKLVEDIQKRLHEIDGWTADTGKDEFIQGNFNYIFQRLPNCIRADYFLYLFDKGSRLKEVGSCKEAIPYLLKAKAVFPLLAKQKNIDLLITESSDCGSNGNICKEKLITVQKLIKDANNFYIKCKYTEALNQYQAAKNFDCNDETKKIITDWKTFEDDINENLALVNLFNQNIRKADSLLIEEDCKQAIELYKSANEIQVKCGQLAKTNIANKIKKAEDCLQKNCVKENRQEAARSVDGRNYVDAIKFYCKAIECADTLTQRKLKEQICETLKLLTDIQKQMIAANPEMVCVNCPIIIIDPKKKTGNEKKCDSCLLVKPELVGLGYLYNYLPKDPVKYSAVSGGIRLRVMSFYNKIPLDFGIGVFYSDNDIKTSTEEITIKQLSIPITLYLHLPNRKMGKINPYFYGEYQPSFPIGFKYISGGNILDGRKYLNSRNDSFVYGAGIAQQWKKWGYSIELFDEYMQDVISISTQTTSIPSDNLKRHSYGIRLGVRFW